MLFNLGSHEILIILIAIAFLTGLPLALYVAAKRIAARRIAARQGRALEDGTGSG